jgi:hypothetical protein
VGNDHHSTSKKSRYAPSIIKEIALLQCTPLLGIFQYCRRHTKHYSIWFRVPETPRRRSRSAIYYTLLATALANQAITNTAHRSRPHHRSKPHVSPLSQPIVSGFEYSRVDLVDEYTELVPEHSENDIYRHPRTLASVHLRSKKSHDIYILGIILIEIAHWKRIQDIAHLPKDERQAKKMIRSLRETLLRKDFVMYLEGLVGDSYSQATVACLEGLVGFEVDEETPAIGVQIQKAFHDRVVAKLRSVRA